MHVGQIDDVRRVVERRDRQAAVVHQRPGAFQPDRLHPVGGLRVEDVQMRLGVD